MISLHLFSSHLNCSFSEMRYVSCCLINFCQTSIGIRLESATPPQFPNNQIILGRLQRRNCVFVAANDAKFAESCDWLGAKWNFYYTQNCWHLFWCNSPCPNISALRWDKQPLHTVRNFYSSRLFIVIPLAAINFELSDFWYGIQSTNLHTDYWLW